MHFARRLTAWILLDYGYSILLRIRWLIFAIIWTRKFFLGFSDGAPNRGCSTILVYPRTSTGIVSSEVNLSFLLLWLTCMLGCLIKISIRSGLIYQSRYPGRQYIVVRFQESADFLSANRYSCRIPWKILLFWNFPGSDDDCGHGM